MEAGKKKKKIWIVLLVAVIVIVIIAILAIAIGKLAGNAVSMANTVQVEQVQAQDLSDYISLSGNVSGIRSTNVTSLASAEVKEVHVQVGDTVQAGDELILLDTSEIEKQMAELKKQIGNADALSKNEASMRDKSLAEAKEDQSAAIRRAAEAINQAQSQVDEAQGQYNSLSSQIDKKAAELNVATNQAAALKPQEDASVEENAAYENALAACSRINEELLELKRSRSECELSITTSKSALASAKENYEDVVKSTNRAISTAQNTIDMAQYQASGTSELSTQLELLQKQLEDCKLTAPCGGVVTAVNVSVGDRYGAGQTMVSIEDTSALKVAVEVKEADILKISEGMKAMIKTTATGDEEISGTVTRVVRVKNHSVNKDALGNAGAVSGYSAEITIDQGNLLIGMSATAKIILKEKKDVLAIPYDLIRYDDDDSAYVLIAEDNGNGQAVAIRKDITVGEEIDYYIEVIGGGLSKGDMLIYDYSGTIVEGSVFTPEEIYEEQRVIPSENDADVEGKVE